MLLPDTPGEQPSNLWRDIAVLLAVFLAVFFVAYAVHLDRADSWRRRVEELERERDDARLQNLRDLEAMSRQLKEFRAILHGK